MNKRFSIRERIKSIGFAMEGLNTFFSTQHNAWLHLFSAALAVAMGFFLKLSNTEWCWITIAIVLVFVAELFNTAIEFLSDIVSPNLHPTIKNVKDISAAAVLFAAIGAAVVGCLIFVPKLCYLFCK
ncbi:MAG: diacylglycerol kinase family protein [Bacteroidota bacterium]|jgi:diacylglycerol kinase (ATP)|nr:diacylglycerol kinase family protein [Bacteroidota bacterium]